MQLTETNKRLSQGKLTPNQLSIYCHCRSRVFNIAANQTTSKNLSDSFATYDYLFREDGKFIEQDLKTHDLSLEEIDTLLLPKSERIISTIALGTIIGNFYGGKVIQRNHNDFGIIFSHLNPQEDKKYLISQWTNLKKTEPHKDLKKTWIGLEELTSNLVLKKN